MITSSSPRAARVRIDSKWLVMILGSLAFVLLLGNLGAIYSTFISHHSLSFAWRFYFDKRLNFPFYFSLILLFINLFFIFRLATKKTLIEGETRFWKVLGIFFMLFTVDETFDLHYLFKIRTYGTIASYNPASLSHYLWVIPYIVIFGFLMIQLKKLSANIPLQVKRGLMLSTALFLFGVVVMEFAGTYYFVVTRSVDLNLMLIKTVEELFQMIGLIAFIRVLSRYRSYEGSANDL